MKLPTPDVIRVRATVSVDIDVWSWIANYGVAPSEVRADVKAHIEQLVRDQLGELGVLA